VRDWNARSDGAGGWWGPIVGLLLVVMAASGTTTAAPPAGGPVGAPGVAAPSGDFSVAVQAIPIVTEPGVPVEFVASVDGGTPPFDFLWSDPAGLSGNGGNFTVWATTPGNLTATVIVSDTAGVWAAASYSEPVLAGVAVGIGATNTTDLGAPFSLTVTVSGGVPPYQTNVSVQGGPSFEETLPVPGAFPFEAWSDRSGRINVTVSVTDAIGALVRTEALAATLAPLPEIALAAGPASVEVGVPCTWWATVVGGTPPIQWSADAAGATANLTGPTGPTSSPGTVAWSFRFNSSGNASVQFAAIDTARAAVSLSVPVRVAPPLETYLSVPTGGSGPSVNLSIEGGVPPYDVILTASDGETWIGNASAPGTSTWTLHPATTSGLNVTARVTDAAGGNSSASLGLPDVGGAPPGVRAGPSGASEVWILLLAAVGGAVAVGVAAGILLRRRRPPTPSAEPPVVPASDEVKRILSESDALERESVYLQGEDRGASRSALEAGIGHWLREGRIEIVRGNGGEELLRWRDDPDPSPSEGP